MDEELYKENILDHYSHPRGKRQMADFTLKGEGVNANCGDELVLYLKLGNDKVTDISFTGTGCAISMAAASMLTEKLKGAEKEKLKTITPGDIYTMLRIRVSPSRSNCALLVYEALEHALKYEPKRNL